MVRLLVVCASLLAGCASFAASPAALEHNRLAAEALGRLGPLPAPETLDDVEARLRLALELAPDLAEAHANLGLVHLARGESDEAAAAFARSVELEPDLAAGHAGLGIVASVRGDLGGAVLHFEAALALQPEFVEARENLVRVLLEAGRFASARAHALRLLALAPTREAAVVGLALAELGLDRPAAALARLEAADSVPEPRSFLALTRARALVALGRVDEGRAAYAALVDDPRVGLAARLGLAVVLAAIGEHDAASAELEEAARTGAPDAALAIVRAELTASGERDRR